MSKLTQLQHELTQRMDVLEWSPYKRRRHLLVFYDVDAVEFLGPEKAEQLGVYLTREFDRVSRENMARTRAEDAAVSDVPHIFR